MAYLRLLRRRDFALLWSGATVSVLGDGLTWVSLVWLVFGLGGSPADLGLLVFCYTAPVIVGGLVAGLLLDRFDRRRVLMLDSAIRGTAMVSVPLAYHVGALQHWHLFVVAAVYGLLNMISLAGIPSLIPDLVDEADLSTANAMESLSYGFGGVAGPAIGGLLVGLIGAPNVLALDAVTYLAFALCLALIRLPTHVFSDETEQPTGRGLGPAIRFLLTTPPVLAITLMFMSFNVAEGMLLVVLPTYARDVLGGDATAFGLLVSAFTAGLLVGALVVGAIRWRWPLGRSIAAFQLAAGLLLLGLVTKPGLVGAALVLAAVGLAGSPLTIWAQTIRMQLIPEALRGRVFSLLRTLMQSTPPAGGILAGAVLSGMPLATAVVLASLLGAVPGLIGLFHRALAPAPYAPRMELSSRAP